MKFPASTEYYYINFQGRNVLVCPLMGTKHTGNNARLDTAHFVKTFLDTYNWKWKLYEHNSNCTSSYELVLVG